MECCALNVMLNILDRVIIVAVTLVASKIFLQLGIINSCNYERKFNGSLFLLGCDLQAVASMCDSGLLRLIQLQ